MSERYDYVILGMLSIDYKPIKYMSRYHIHVDVRCRLSNFVIHDVKGEGITLGKYKY